MVFLSDARVVTWIFATQQKLQSATFLDTNQLSSSADLSTLPFLEKHENDQGRNEKNETEPIKAHQAQAKATKYH
tara:strand:- start:168 stop:392 length:225 start_codon:yes stop_codon:yes gene_type:complete